MNSYVGKTLKDENGQDYVILNELFYKSIPCCFAMKVTDNDEVGEKKLFQIVDKNHLTDIKSKKMLKTLSDMLFKENTINERPRKIKENESIESYFAYLDEYYKTKVVTII